jgi:Mlc titration factor MtfA (ptsG expression regulator)
MKWLWRTRRELLIDEPAWQCLQSELPFLATLPTGDSSLLRERMAQFLTETTITGVRGLQVSDAMRLQVAAQACLPVLRLGLQAYDRFSEVILYPSAFSVRRRIDSPEGMVTEFDDVLTGEAMPGGPVVLSWPDTTLTDEAWPGTNLVIHEFAHKLDMASGLPDGCPPMPRSQQASWFTTLSEAFEAFARMVDRVEAAIPGDIDPDSEAADPWFALLPLDPYAATDLAEFFAVSTEKFFINPQALCAEFPELFAAYRQYFGFVTDPTMTDQRI